MIRLFVVDLDGCITHPFITPDWDAITQIRNLNREAHTNPHIPLLSICTGRPLPYAEAVAQWLDIRIPFAYESGSGLYSLTDHVIRWTPHLTPDRLRQVDALKRWTSEVVIPKFPGCNPEFTKRTDIGLIHPDMEINQQIRQFVIPFVHENYPDFEVHDTDVSVNIILSDCNKGSGLRFLAETTGIPVHEMAYIGDSSGDVPAMKVAARSFAPSNARPEAKAHAQTIQKEATFAVLEAYQLLIEGNKKKIGD